jgi:hypothetical protein
MSTLMKPKNHQGRAVGVGGVLADRQVGLVAEQLVQRVVALAVGRHDLLPRLERQRHAGKAHFPGLLFP